MQCKVNDRGVFIKSIDIASKYRTWRVSTYQEACVYSVQCIIVDANQISE